MPVSTETCNNGGSVLVSDVSLPLQKSSVKTKPFVTLVLIELFVLLSIVNVTMKDTLLESVKILHSLTSTSKFNLSLSQIT